MRLRSVILVLASLSIGLTGCEQPTTPEASTPEAGAPSLDRVPTGAPQHRRPVRTPDDDWEELANGEAPGFAGIALEDGQLVMLTTPAADRGLAEAAFRAKYAQAEVFQQPFNHREVRYNFAQLRRWMRLVVRARKDHDLSFFDVDEAANVVRFGSRTAEGVAAIRATLETGHVPLDAYTIEVLPPFEYQSDLTAHLRPVPGGAQIANWNNQGCSLGTNVKVDGRLGYFVTASHCTMSQYVGQMTSSAFYQERNEWGLNRIGEEISDPVWFTDGDCPWDAYCRWSDAALVDYDFASDADDYTIAKPNIGSTIFSDEYAVTAAYGETFILNVPYVGMPITMVGAASGRQTGQITSTCGGAVGEDGTVYPCAYFGDYDAQLGDSGAPVFRVQGDQAWIYGIHSGQTYQGFSVFSLWSLAISEFDDDGFEVRARP